MPILYLLRMQFPFSFRNEPWASFDKQSYAIFTDDFVHDKIFTTKFHYARERWWNVKLTESITRKDASYRIGTDVKMSIPLWDDAYLCFRSKGEGFKVHYDHGMIGRTSSDGKTRYFNFYGSYQSTKDFKNVALKAGLNYLTHNLSFGNRVRVEPGKDLNSSGISTGHKLVWANDKWSFDAYEMVDWKKMTCQSNALRFGFRQGDN